MIRLTALYGKGVSISALRIRQRPWFVSLLVRGCSSP